jgi:hypothetical protein
MANPVQDQTENPSLSEVSVLDKAFASNDPDQRKQAANLINQKITNDKVGHVNTQTQWLDLIGSLMSRDYKGARIAWDGGAPQQIEALGPDNKRYLKEYNARGITGRVFDPNGKELNPDQIQALDDQGGLISNKDVNALQTGQWQSTLANITESQAAMRKPALEALSAAQQAGVESAGLANLYSERQQLARKSSWMNEIAKLPPAERARLFEAQSRQVQTNQGEQKGTSTSTSATQGTNVGQQQGASLGGDFGLGTKGGGLAPPPGTPSGAGIRPPMAGFPAMNLGASAGGTSGSYTGAQTSNTQSAGSTANTSTSAGNQAQMDVRSQIEGVLNRKMDDKEFAEYQRYLQLTGQINESLAKRPVQKLAPGAQAVAPVDPALSGSRNAQIEDFHGIKNEALLSAWNHYYADQINANRGKTPNLAKLAEDFQGTDVAKGINNYYDRKIEEVKGQKYVPSNGDIIVDKSNRPLVWRNGKWEKLKNE